MHRLIERCGSRSEQWLPLFMQGPSEH
jgi:hypothetical protein